MESPNTNTHAKTPKDESFHKTSPDVSTLNDPINLRHQHRFDVSRQKRGSVIIVDYKNDSPFSNRASSPSKESPKKSGFGSTPMTRNNNYSKSAFARPAPQTPSSRVDSLAGTPQKKSVNVLSFAKWQKAFMRNSTFKRTQSAMSMKRSVQKDLENTLQRQKKEPHDFGDKITAMCVSTDERYVIIATHHVESAPKIKVQAAETLQTQQTENMSTGRLNDEKPLLNMATGRSRIPSVGDPAIDEKGITFTQSAQQIDENATAIKRPPALWVFDMKERIRERLPLDQNFDDPQREIVALAIPKSNEHIIIGSNDRSMYLYSLKDKEIAYYFRNVIEQNITSINVTHDEKYCLVSGSKDGLINVFSIPLKTLAYTLKDPEQKDWMKCVALSPDPNNTLVVAGYYDGTISVIERESRNVLHRFTINPDQNQTNRKNLNFIGTLQVTNDLKYVVVGCDDKSILIWSIKDQKFAHTFNHVHEKKITTLSIASDDKFLISGSFDGSIAIIDLEKRQLIHSYPAVHQGVISHIFLTATSRYIISGGSDGTMQILDLQRKELIGEIPDTHKGGVDALAVSLDNRYIASASYDGSIMFHYLETRKLLKCIENAHSCPIKTIKYTTDGKHLVSGGDDGTVKIWAIFTWELVHAYTSLHQNWVTTLAITTNDKILVSGSLDNSIKITLLGPYEHLHTYSNAHSSGVTCLKITSNNRMIISGGGDGTIRVSNMNFKKKGTLHIFSDAHKGPVKALAITRDNRYFVSASTNGSIKIFYLEKREYLHTIKHAHDNEINALSLSRDNKYIISASSDNSVQIFDFRTRKRIHTIQSAHAKSISSMTVSLDNYYIITGSNDNSIKIFMNPYSTINFTVTESNRISAISYLGLFVLNYFLNEADPDIKHNMITKYQDLAIYPYQLNLFHIVALFFPKKDLIKFCIESGIHFSGDSYGRTPLHYLLNSEKVDFNNINYLLENFDNIHLNATESFKLMAEVTQDLPSILKLSPHLVVNLLRNAVGNPLSYKNANITQFGHILGGGQRRCVPYKMPIFTPEIKNMLLDEGGTQLLSVKVVMFHMDYDICSEELLKVLNALQTVDNEEIFMTKAISVMIDYAWARSKVHLYLLMLLYSAYMILLSVYASQQSTERDLAIEVILLVFGFGFLGYEGLQLLSSGWQIYFSDIWNFVDIIGNCTMIATIFTYEAHPDSLSSKWLVTVTLFLGYAKWISFFRIISQTRKLIRIIIQIVTETKYLGFLLFVAIMGFSLIFYQFDEPAEISYSSRLLLVYNLLYAQFNNDDYKESQIFYLVFVTIILTVILINLLIAIMTEIFKKILMTSIMADSKERLLLTIETITVKRMMQKIWNKITKCFRRDRGHLYKETPEAKKSYLFYVEDAKIQIEEENRYKEWERRFKLVREIVDAEMQTNNDIMKAKMIGLEEHVHKQQAHMMVMKESLGKRLTELEKNMAKAIGAIQAAKAKHN